MTAADTENFMTSTTIETEKRGADSQQRIFHRDGVWTSNGLSADFRVIYEHPNCDGVYRVQTASGEHYAHKSALAWDFFSER